jgi:hypothetical protein
VSIESIPDDVLLAIFYQVRVSNHYEWHLQWPNLVHVCQRWRFVIFTSPLRLELQLFCTPKVPVRKLLDIWPTFPLVVEVDSEWPREAKIDNLIAALEHRDRVQKITISDPLTRDGLWERIATVMQEPFPELNYLSLESFSGVLPFPNTFFNGSASRLQHIFLWGISFPCCHDSSCLQETSKFFIFAIYLILGTSHPREWLHACPGCRSSNPSSSDSNLRRLNPNEETDLYPHRPGLFSPLSLIWSFEASASIWKFSRPESTHLYSGSIT